MTPSPEQRFTDEDLKRLKERIATRPVLRRVYQLDALLARLEAAEGLLNLYLPRHHPAHKERLGQTIDLNHCFYCKAFYAWRRVVGKLAK